MMRTVLALVFLSFFIQKSVAQPVVEKGKWEENASGSGFGFWIPGLTHAILYMTCDAGSGWIAVVQNNPRRPDRLMIMRSGKVEVRPLTRSGDGGLLGDYTETMIPEGHAIFSRIAAGNSLSINSSIYPMRTVAERRGFSAFRATCVNDL